jgi:hypothetical protein
VKNAIKGKFSINYSLCSIHFEKHKCFEESIEIQMEEENSTQKFKLLKEWHEEDIIKWLKGIDIDDNVLFERIKNEKITGKSLFELKEDDLKELQMKMGDRKIFLKEIEKLKEGNFFIILKVN